MTERELMAILIGLPVVDFPLAQLADQKIIERLKEENFQRQEFQYRRPDLEESMKAIGQTDPILIIIDKNKEVHVPRGNSRLFVAAKLGWPTIKARVFEDVNGDITPDLMLTLRADQQQKGLRWLAGYRKFEKLCDAGHAGKKTFIVQQLYSDFDAQKDTAQRDKLDAMPWDKRISDGYNTDYNYCLWVYTLKHADPEVGALAERSLADQMLTVKGADGTEKPERKLKVSEVRDLALALQKDRAALHEAGKGPAYTDAKAAVFASGERTGQKFGQLMSIQQVKDKLVVNEHRIVALCGLYVCQMISDDEFNKALADESVNVREIAIERQAKLDGVKKTLAEQSKERKTLAAQLNADGADIIPLQPTPAPAPAHTSKRSKGK